MYLLDSAFCGCNLKFGCYLWGWVILILAGSNMLFFALNYPNNTTNINDPRAIFFRKPDDGKGIFYILAFTMSVILLCSGLILLIGADQEKPSLLMLSILIVGAEYVVDLGCMVAVVYRFIEMGDQMGPPFIVLIVIKAALYFYFYMVTYSFYKCIRYREE